MRLLRSTRDGIRALRDKRARNDEIDGELESFLRESINDKMRRGMTAKDAIRAARAEVGSASAVKHKVWRAGWESRVDLLWKDFTYTLRRLSRLPGLVFIVAFSGFNVNFVGIHDYAVGVMATEHLFETGRRRIAHIRGPETSVGWRRFEGLRGRRHQVLLSTKCGRYGVNEFDFSRTRILQSVHDSLERLQMDYVDLLLAHDVEFGDVEQIIRETIPAMRELQKRGVAHHVGISGYPLAVLPRIAERIEVDVILS